MGKRIPLNRASGSVGRRAVFLDRDGVLNRAEIRNGRPYAPTRVEDFKLLAGVRGAVAALKRGGFLVIVATNQPDPALGKAPRSVVDAMHDILRRELPVDDIRVCFHREEDGCECRKPKPGLLLAAAREHGIDLAASIMIGDRWRDVGAGRAAGCWTVLVDHGYDEPMLDAPHVIVTSLAEAVPFVLDRIVGTG